MQLKLSGSINMPYITVSWLDAWYICLCGRVCVCVCSPARANSNVLVGWSKRYWGIIPTLPSHCSHLYQQDTAGQIRHVQTQPSPMVQSHSGNFARPHKHIQVQGFPSRLFISIYFLLLETKQSPAAAAQFENNLRVTDGMGRDIGPDQACTPFPQWPERMTPSTDSGWAGSDFKFQTCVCECKCCLCVRALCAWHSSLPH